MKYCNSCGNLISDRARKCRHCGVNLKNRDYIYQPSEKYFEKYADPQKKHSLKYKIMEKIENPSTPMKKSLWPIFPFLIVPGIGLMYAGNIYKGIKFFVVFLVVVFVDVFTKVVLQNYTLVFAVIPAYLISITWGIIAAVKELKIYNQNVENIQRKQYPSKKIDSSVYQ